MCHERWLRRRAEEREASRRLWDEFEQTRPLSGPEVNDEDVEATLETGEPEPVAVDPD
jgi:hypothetical protein